MPRRQRQQQQGQSSAPTATPQEPNSSAQSQSNESANDRDRPPPPKGSLKEFVDKYKDKHHRVIEMRIALVCSFGIFAKVLFSDVLTQSGDNQITYATLVFVALCVLVIIFNTWLDFFPVRLREVETRESKGQGIPLACLLVPMVCCAQLYCSLYFAKHLTDLLVMYLVMLCMLSLCSIVATLLYSIPFPNNVTIYNFSVIGVAYVVQQYLGVSMWVMIPAVSAYSLLCSWLVNTFPRSFTLGEAMILAQGLTVVFIDSSMQLLKMYDIITLPDSWNILRTESVLYIELLLMGVAICCILLSPALYKLSEARHYHEKKFWSGTFILLSLSIGFMLILPWLGQLLGGNHPIPYLLIYTVSYPVRLVLVAFWLIVSTATIIIMCAQSSDGNWAIPLKALSSSSLMRKMFHLSALLVFLPGIALDPNFTSLAASLITFFFVVFELARIFRMWPFGEGLHRLFVPMLDSRDKGLAIVSHIYLLLGLALPLWLCPLREYNRVGKLSMYAGVLSIGVGDAVASVAGQKFGKVKWPGTNKTLEGSLMSIFAQIVTVFIIIIIDPHLGLFSASQWITISGVIAVTAALEAYTWQIDNLVLGIFQFAMITAFLN